VGVGDKAGVYAAFDRTTGETVWARQLADGSALGGVMVTAAYGKGVVYVTCNVMAGEYPANPTDPRHRSVTYALDAATGRIRWQGEIPGAPAAQPAGAPPPVGDLCPGRRYRQDPLAARHAGGHLRGPDACQRRAVPA